MSQTQYGLKDGIHLHKSRKHCSERRQCYLLALTPYLLLLMVAYLSDAPRRRLVVTGIEQRYRTKLLRGLPGSLMSSVYDTATRDFGLKSHPTDD